MTVEVRPLGVKCNLSCEYCYQEPMRQAGNVLHSYDADRLLDIVTSNTEEFSLFGGEPLLMSTRLLERFVTRTEGAGRRSIQTNGSLITDRHVEIFIEHDVGVGISVDGPGELNDARWAGSLEKTRRATASTHRAIEMLVAAGHPPSLIVTLNRCNASAERLPRLEAWLRAIDAMGIGCVRLHILEVENEDIRERYGLSEAENIHAFLRLLALEDQLESVRFDLFSDIRNLLRGRDDRVTCVWNACDPYTTRAVQGIDGNGQVTNCGRTNKRGVEFVKSPVAGYERYLVLAGAPQEHGGCRGCRFLAMCKGQCPGTAVDGDWRNRSEHCGVWKRLFEVLADQLIASGEVPLSESPERSRIEAELIRGWREGRTPALHELCDELGRREASS